MPLHIQCTSTLSSDRLTLLSPSMITLCILDASRGRPYASSKHRPFMLLPNTVLVSSDRCVLLGYLEGIATYNLCLSFSPVCVLGCVLGCAAGIDRKEHFSFLGRRSYLCRSFFLSGFICQVTLTELIGRCRPGVLKRTSLCVQHFLPLCIFIQCCFTTAG